MRCAIRFAHFDPVWVGLIGAGAPCSFPKRLYWLLEVQLERAGAWSPLEPLESGAAALQPHDMHSRPAGPRRKSAGPQRPQGTSTAPAQPMDTWSGQARQGNRASAGRQSGCDHNGNSVGKRRASAGPAPPALEGWRVAGGTLEVVGGVAAVDLQLVSFRGSRTALKIDREQPSVEFVLPMDNHCCKHWCVLVPKARRATAPARLPDSRCLPHSL